jgi:hypothetical protein
MIGYHATSNLDQILKAGCVKPLRMPNVYLFTKYVDAEWYMKEFKLDAVVSVEYDRKDVASKWKPKYAKTGYVVKLKAGKKADLAGVIIYTGTEPSSYALSQ